MNIWHDIDKDRVKPEEFVAVVEIQKGSKQKYEMDKKTGLLILDRILYTSTHYPANYGFIPHTLAEDGDPLDVLILCSEELLPMSLVKCYPIGVITMKDNGSVDEKIIAIPLTDPTYNNYKSISDLPQHVFDEMRHFFMVYKQLENKETAVDYAADRDEAVKIIQNASNAITTTFSKYSTENKKRRPAIGRFFTVGIMKYVFQFLLILLVSFVAEILHALIPLPVPASIYGLVILFVLLCTKAVRLEHVEKAGDFLLKVMPMLFIPAGVGVMTAAELLYRNLWVVLVSMTAVTAFVMVVTGVIAQALTKKKRPAAARAEEPTAETAAPAEAREEGDNAELPQ